MRSLYILIPVVFIFFHLTGFALGDLLGMHANIFAFIIVGAFIMAIDTIGDHVFRHKLQFYVIKRTDRFRLTAYAIAVWIGLDLLMTGIMFASNPDYALIDLVYYIRAPGLFISAGLMGIAVWYSLGYVLSDGKTATQEKKPEETADHYIKQRKTSANIAEQIKLEKDKNR